jgi:UDP-N-acetyl-D-mannosaminuronic acid dehydrogenase
MTLVLEGDQAHDWRIRKIAVVGPGIVGMPMAALLANARITEGTDRPAEVVVIQRDSSTSGWKVRAINDGRSPIGGVEPALDRIVADSVRDKLLRASTDFAEVRDADVILICVQTDKVGLGPDYGPLFEATNAIAAALRDKPAGNVPLIIFESTLAPSSMQTVIRPLFARYGLEEGRDILLGNSPNRVMPGRLIERVAQADKLAAGLHPATPILIRRLYQRIVTRGMVHTTNSLTAEVVKTLENAYRDVRIAYAAELVRYCDANDIDFFALRQLANEQLADVDAASENPRAVPSGAVLVPTVGVGGHCLPKDGILLWWRLNEAGVDNSKSLILESRRVNDESPAETIRLAERSFGSVSGRRAAILGVAYRFDSEDTRNSPSLALARSLLERSCEVTLHDPHVNPHDQNLQRGQLESRFTREMSDALSRADVVFICTAHRAYEEQRGAILELARRDVAVVDGCNLLRPADLNGASARYTGIGRGRTAPSEALVQFAVEGFRAVEHGVANELATVIDYLNTHYAGDDFNRVRFTEVQRLARTCTTGCDIADPRRVATAPSYRGFTPRLVRVAVG